MDNINNVAKLYRGDDFEIGKIKIKQPTINDIIDFDEKKYWDLLHTFVSTPFDMVAQLDMIGIDFTTISNFELFLLLVRNYSVDDTKILFGEELDFHNAIIANKDDELILYFNNGIEINQYTHTVISEYLRKVHNLPRTLRPPG